MDSIKQFIKKWLPLLEKINKDESLKERCKNYNAYIPCDENDRLLDELQFLLFLKEAYDSEIVRPDYLSFGEDMQKEIFHPSDDFINSLSELNIIRCITWHFRADHFDNGFLICSSFASGALLKYFKALDEVIS